MKRRDLFGKRMQSLYLFGILLSACCPSNSLQAQQVIATPAGESDIEVHWRSTTSRQSE